MKANIKKKKHMVIDYKIIESCKKFNFNTQWSIKNDFFFFNYKHIIQFVLLFFFFFLRKFIEIYTLPMLLLLQHLDILAPFKRG